MDNPENVLQLLETFSNGKGEEEIPQELNEYITYVARTGQSVFQWKLVRILLRRKLAAVLNDFANEVGLDVPQCPNVDPFNYKVMREELLNKLESFKCAPFTVQRLCELLSNPRKEYARIDKYMRAVEKNVNISNGYDYGDLNYYNMASSSASVASFGDHCDEDSFSYADNAFAPRKMGEGRNQRRRLKINTREFDSPLFEDSLLNEGATAVDESEEISVDSEFLFEIMNSGDGEDEEDRNGSGSNYPLGDLSAAFGGGNHCVNVAKLTEAPIPALETLVDVCGTSREESRFSKQQQQPYMGSDFDDGHDGSSLFGEREGRLVLYDGFEKFFKGCDGLKKATLVEPGTDDMELGLEEKRMEDGGPKTLTELKVSESVFPVGITANELSKIFSDSAHQSQSGEGVAAAMATSSAAFTSPLFLESLASTAENFSEIFSSLVTNNEEDDDGNSGEEENMDEDDENEEERVLLDLK